MFRMLTSPVAPKPHAEGLTMRLTLLVAALLAVMAPTPGRADDADAEKEVAKLSKQMTDAFVKGDMAFVDGVMADDWMIIVGNGVGDKPQLLKDVKDGTLKYEALDKFEMKVRVYGEAAVVTGRSQSRIKVKGHEVGGLDRFSEVYARQGGKWRCVSTHVSPITAQSGEKP
jgi:ketosteroid isomerase-like protein